MKRVYGCIAAAFALLLTGCSGQTSAANDWRIISMYQLAEPQKNGAFIMNDSRLDFLDVQANTSIPLCDEPSCTHSSESDCTAYGKSNHPFFYGDKLCWFTMTEYYETDSGYQADVQLWQSDANGSNAEMLLVEKGASCMGAERFVLDGDVLYYFVTRQTYDMEFQENEPSISLHAYNFKTEETMQYGEVVKGYSCGMWTLGIWEEKLYATASAAEVNLPYLDRLLAYAEENNLTQDEAMTLFMQEDRYIEKHLTLNLSTGEWTEVQDVPMLLSARFWYNRDENGFYAEDHNGKRFSIYDNDVISAEMYGDYCWLHTNEGMKLWSEETQTLYALSLSENQYLCDICGEYAVIQTSGNGTSMYHSVPVEEILS